MLQEAIVLASITDLPAEINVDIFLYCTDFDGVLNLARVSKFLYNVYQSNRLHILRSIVKHSDVYINDLRLCKIIEQNWRLRTIYETSPYPTWYHAKRPQLVTGLEELLEGVSDDPSDSEIEDIFVRYFVLKDLRVLFNRNLKVEQMTQPCYFDPQLPRDPARFHKAVVAYWLAVEGRLYAKNMILPDDPAKHGAHEYAQALWWRFTKRESGFRLPNYSDLTAIMDMRTVRVFCQECPISQVAGIHVMGWVAGVPPSHTSFMEQRDGFLHVGLVKHIGYVIRPADIVELYALNECVDEQGRKRDWPAEGMRSRYMQIRGLFDRGMTRLDWVGPFSRC